MTIALDPGAHELRSLRQRGGELVARRCRTIAAFVDDNEARRRWLTTAGIPHLVAENCLVIPGDAAVEAEGLCDTVPLDLLPGGDLPAADPVTRQVIAALVDGLLPRSLNRGEVCCFAQPGHDDSLSADEAFGGQRLEFFTQLIQLRGYTALPINPATALVLAELATEGLTGIGLALGSSGCDLAVVHRGNQIACVRLAAGGGWMDEQLARRQHIIRRDSDGNNVLDLHHARIQKEGVSLGDLSNAVSQAVSDLYQDVIAELVDGLAGLLASDPRISLLPQPLPMVCSGGPAYITGFGEALQTALACCDPALDLGRLQLVSEPDYAIARGCLIRAELEDAVLPDVTRNVGNVARARHSAAPRG
ncbi:MAG TPA: hypothetical protein VGM05_13590 [Planctomycetaceae bacterium]